MLRLAILSITTLKGPIGTSEGFVFLCRNFPANMEQIIFMIVQHQE